MNAPNRQQIEYRRQLMSLEVPLSVVIARKSIELETILQLVPGSMLQFNQMCDDPLSLEVIGKKIGSGVAVKIGDKFGLKITEMVNDKE
jgi:flagellar motor switch protein FliN